MCNSLAVISELLNKRPYTFFTFCIFRSRVVLFEGLSVCSAYWKCLAYVISTKGKTDYSRLARKILVLRMAFSIHTGCSYMHDHFCIWDLIYCEYPKLVMLAALLCVCPFAAFFKHYLEQRCSGQHLTERHRSLGRTLAMKIADVTKSQILKEKWTWQVQEMLQKISK